MQVGSHVKELYKRGSKKRLYCKTKQIKVHFWGFGLGSQISKNLVIMEIDQSIN